MHFDNARSVDDSQERHKLPISSRFFMKVQATLSIEMLYKRGYQNATKTVEVRTLRTQLPRCTLWKSLFGMRR